MCKKVLVTGGAGFLGSHLCDSLILSGYNVTALDNLSTGNLDNISHLLSNPKFKFINRDVQLPIIGFDTLDEIWNLACPASPPMYQLDPVDTLKTNFLGALNVLNLAKSTGAKVFQASTSEVYGDPAIHPQPESYWGNVNTVGPRSCYDEGKRVVESLMTDYSKQYGVPIKIARIFNTYGPRLHPADGRVVSNFINQALAGSPITVYGTGNQSRSFCYVADLIEGFRLLMDAPSDFTLPVNIGTPAEFTMLQLAKLIIDKTGSKSKLEYNSLPVDDPWQRKPDITLAKTILGWEPKITLSAGLDLTINHFMSKH